MNLSEHKLNDPNSGLMLVDKPSGWTSHDVVNFVRRRFGFKKVGHCGTLDPSATGLLILVVGHATKVADYLAKDHKVYRTILKLGESTSSHDADGEVIEEKSFEHVTEEQVRKVLGDLLAIKCKCLQWFLLLKKVVRNFMSWLVKALRLKEIHEKLRFMN